MYGVNSGTNYQSSYVLEEPNDDDDDEEDLDDEEEGFERDPTNQAEMLHRYQRPESVYNNNSY